MKERVPAWCVTALLPLVVPVAAQGQTIPEEVSLRPAFVSGQWARYEFWTRRHRHVTASAQGQKHTAQTVMEFSGAILWSVQRVAGDGSATCVMTLEWMTASVDQGRGAPPQHNDSRKTRGDNEQTHQMLRAMAGVPLTVEVSADGSVRAVRGVEAMKRKAPDVNLPDELDFIETASDLATLVAAPPLSRNGSTWNTESLWKHPMGKIRQATRYQLDSVDIVEGVPLANVTGQARPRLEVDQGKFGSARPGQRVDVRLTDSSYQTQVMFDLDRHEAVGRNSILTTSIRVSVSVMDRSFVSQIDETVHSQALRVAEGP